MPHSAVDAYRQTEARTSDRGELLLMLYDGALRYAETARNAILRGDPAAKGQALDAFLAIIIEFTRTLDPRQAPELCNQLHNLYAYYIHRAQQAGLRMDPAPLEEIIVHLTGLRQSWAEAIQIAKKEGVL